MGLCQAGSSSLLRCHECQCLPLSTASCSASGSAGLGALKRSPEKWGACSPCHLHSSVGPAAWGTLAVENPQTILPCTACCCHTWHALTARCYWHQELAPGRSAELKSPWTSANEQTFHTPHYAHARKLQELHLCQDLLKDTSLWASSASASPGRQTANEEVHLEQLS